MIAPAMQQQSTDHALSPLAAELSAMLRLEGDRIELEKDPLERWSSSIARRSDFDPSALVIEVVALGLKIRRLVGEAGDPALAQLDAIAQMLIERVDPEQAAELRGREEEGLAKATGAARAKRAPIYDQAAPAGTFTIASLGPNLAPPRRRTRK